MLASGAFHEFHRLSDRPMTVGLSVPPKFPNVFMAPLTTPACGPPISRQTAQAGATPSAARPAPAASSQAERSAFDVDTAVATASAASGKPTTPGARRPARSPQPPPGTSP